MVSRTKTLIRTLEDLVKQEHLFSEEKLREMKTQLRVLKQQIAEIDLAQKKGFGKR
tara:strand:- start:375 stop:542 length:168 start_codon:yes stop_codon:yes gene_type:complete